MAYIQQTHTHFNVTHELLLKIPCGDTHLTHTHTKPKQKETCGMVITSLFIRQYLAAVRLKTWKYTSLLYIHIYIIHASIHNIINVLLYTRKCISCSSLASIHGNSYTSFPHSLKGYMKHGNYTSASNHPYSLIARPDCFNKPDLQRSELNCACQSSTVRSAI